MLIDHHVFQAVENVLKIGKKFPIDTHREVSLDCFCDPPLLASAEEFNWTSLDRNNCLVSLLQHHVTSPSGTLTCSYLPIRSQRKLKGYVNWGNTLGARPTVHRTAEFWIIVEFWVCQLVSWTNFGNIIFFSFFHDHREQKWFQLLHFCSNSST